MATDIPTENSGSTPSEREIHLQNTGLDLAHELSAAFPGMHSIEELEQVAMEAAKEMAEAEEGWILWGAPVDEEGGVAGEFCPTGLNNYVEYVVRSGYMHQQFARDLNWTECDSDTIVKFRVLKVDPPLEKIETVNHPAHYNQSAAKCLSCGHPIECIDVIEHMPLNIGNAVKYAWRAGLKGNLVEDLKKGIWYLNREIERISR